MSKSNLSDWAGAVAHHGLRGCRACDCGQRWPVVALANRPLEIESGIVYVFDKKTHFDADFVRGRVLGVYYVCTT